MNQNAATTVAFETTGAETMDLHHAELRQEQLHAIEELRQQMEGQGVGPRRFEWFFARWMFRRGEKSIGIWRVETQRLSLLKFEMKQT